MGGEFERECVRLVKEDPYTGTNSAYKHSSTGKIQAIYHKGAELAVSLFTGDELTNDNYLPDIKGDGYYDEVKSWSADPKPKYNNSDWNHFAPSLTKKHFNKYISKGIRRVWWVRYSIKEGWVQVVGYTAVSEIREEWIYQEWRNDYVPLNGKDCIRTVIDSWL